MKSCRKILCFSFIILISCSTQKKLKELEDSFITKIELYYIPFHLEFRRRIKIEQIKKRAFKKLIVFNDYKQSFDSVNKSLISIIPSENDKTYDIRLLAYLHYDNNKKIAVCFSKFGNIHINGKNYLPNKELLNSILIYIT